MQPNAGSGSQQKFSFKIPVKGVDPSRVAFVQVLFGNANASAPPFCLVHYDPSAKALRVYRGPGPLDFTSPATPGTPSGDLQNTFCKVDSTASAASFSGDELDLAITVGFLGPMAGDRVVYWRLQQTSGADSGWQSVGNWTVTP